MGYMLGKAFVRRYYNKYRALYWPTGNLPDFDELSFEFSEPSKKSGWEWGSVEWDEDDHPSLSLHPTCRNSASIIKATLLHELIHIFLGSKLGHGREFWAEADRLNLVHRAYREFF